MQVRALKQKLVVRDIPVSYNRRIGVSKISGTVRGVVLAGTYILGTIFAERLGRGPKPAKARAKPQVFDMSKHDAFSRARDAKLHSIVS